MSWQTWSVMVGTSWLLIEAPTEYAARIGALVRLGFPMRYVDDPTTPMGRRRAPVNERLLDLVTARPATDADIEAFAELHTATTAKGGARGRLAHLQGGPT